MSVAGKAGKLKSSAIHILLKLSSVHVYVLCVSLRTVRYEMNLDLVAHD